MHSVSIDSTFEHIIQVNGEDHSMEVQKATVTGFVKSTNDNIFWLGCFTELSSSYKIHLRISILYCSFKLLETILLFSKVADHI